MYVIVKIAAGNFSYYIGGIIYCPKFLMLRDVEADRFNFEFVLEEFLVNIKSHSFISGLS